MRTFKIYLEQNKDILKVINSVQINNTPNKEFYNSSQLYI